MSTVQALDIKAEVAALTATLVAWRDAGYEWGMRLHG